ncbi:MAG: carbon-nitrogen hydrolase family protein [Planctomycetota bacterium]|jgi:predicted amidohydrolase
MNIKKIAAISLTNKDFPSFAAKLEDVVTWVEHAAKQGVDLAVLPESLNLYSGDGPDNPNALGISDVALADWQNETANLIDAARRLKIALTIPVFTREENCLTNSFFLISKTGEVLGSYEKIYPTNEELDENVRPGSPSVIEWEGLKVGGAICFDSQFEYTFSSQAELGADLFLMPSLWPGGDQLNHFAFKYSAPIILSYPAWSRIIDITGKELAVGGGRWETLRFGFGSPVIMADINFDKVALSANHNQPKMVEVEKKYGSKIKVEFDQQNTTFFMESLADDLTVADVMADFDLISRKDMLAQAEEKINKAREKHST